MLELGELPYTIVFRVRPPLGETSQAAPAIRNYPTCNIFGGFLRGPLLVGFFLFALVMHGGCQQWWIEPVLSSLSEWPLMIGAMLRPR